MTGSTSFNIQGATPGVINSVSKASQAGSYDATNGAGAYNRSQTTSPAISSAQLGSLTGLLKDQGGSQTIAHPDGTTVTHTIKAPKTAIDPSATTTYGQSVNNIGNTANQGAQAVFDTANQGANNITNAGFSGPYNQGLINSVNNLNQTAGYNTTLGQNAQDIANTAGQKISDIGQAGARAGAGVLTTGTSPVAFGNDAVLNNSIAAEQNAISQGAQTALQGNQQAIGAQSQQQSAYGQAGNLAGTGLSNQIGASNSAANVAVGGSENAAGLTTNAANQQATDTAPQSYGLTNQPYNPTTDTYGGGGNGGVINRATNAANIGSAQDLQTQINSGQQALTSAQNNFNLLNSIASQGGIPSNTPIQNIITGKVANIVGGDSTVKAFIAQLNSIRSAYASILGGDGTQLIPDGVTVGDLQALQQTLNKNAQIQIDSKKGQLSQIASGGNSNDPLSIF